MRFKFVKKCPHCGHENEEGAKACLNCHAELDPTPASQPLPPTEDPALAMRVVASFGNVVDADVFKTRLEAAGIEAFIPEEYTPQILWAAIVSPLEGVTVRVDAKDYEAARALYESFEASGAVPSRISPSNTGTGAKREAMAERVEDSQPRKLCVACNAKIPEAAGVCPKCGWTQPGS